MDIRRINKKVAVSPQIRARDMAKIAKAGFATIVNCRPDNEAKRQPTSTRLKKAAQKYGLAYYDIPVVGNQISEADISAFDNVLKSEIGSVLAFCGTGTRSIKLWALSQAGKMPTDEILSVAQENGYDLSALRSRLDQKVSSAHYVPLPGL